ncbi:MAG TPA: GNAT family N-acetyltransferase, partial [Microbacterium sp.]|nr:GNAT family N-acetyltransferase [Microbacterium sp.]
HYGAMDDGVNRGDETDRILVAWAIASAPALTPPDDRVAAAVEVPADIETLRRSDPMAASAWRLRVREQLLAHLADGLVIGGFDDARGYLLVRP